MRTTNPLLPQPEKDKIENVKQQQHEVQHVLDKRVVPHKNHTLFEYDTKTRTISPATFEVVKEIHWDDAVALFDKKSNKTSIEDFGMNTKGRVIKKPNCLYISCLNEENVIKILKRDYGIKK